MVMYLSIIFIAVIFVSTFNILCNNMTAGYSPFWTICVVLLGVVIEIAIDGILAYVIHSMPNKWFSKDKKIFEVSRRERKFYEKLNIKNWKDRVAELGALGGFRKNKVRNPNDPKYLEQFIIENNKGIVLHVAGIIFGFLILLFPMPKYALYIGLPIALVNLYLSLLSTMVLRYNIPKLKVALQRATKQANLAQNESKEEPQNDSQTKQSSDKTATETEPQAESQGEDLDKINDNSVPNENEHQKEEVAEDNKKHTSKKEKSVDNKKSSTKK